MNGLDCLGVVDIASMFKGLSGNSQASGQAQNVPTVTVLERQLVEEKGRTKSAQHLALAAAGFSVVTGVLGFLLGAR